MLYRIWLNLAFYGGILACTIIYLAVSPVFVCWQLLSQPQPCKIIIRTFAHHYGHMCCRLLFSLVPLHIEDCNRHFPEPCIFVCNHQSFFDPYCIGMIPITNFVYVVRSWPFRIPLYGLVMRYMGYLNIESIDADIFLAQAGNLLRQGVNIIIFPEGTRSPDGKLGRFHSGAFRLAIENDVPIVPICLNGTGKVFPKDGFFGNKAPIHITALEEICPESYKKNWKLPHLQLQRDVKARIQLALDSDQ